MPSLRGGSSCTTTVACDNAMNWMVVENINTMHHGHSA